MASGIEEVVSTSSALLLAQTSSIEKGNERLYIKKASRGMTARSKSDAHTPVSASSHWLSSDHVAATRSRRFVTLGRSR